MTQIEGGDFEEAVRLANRVLAIRGQVLPAPAMPLDDARPAPRRDAVVDGQSVITKSIGIERAWVTPEGIARLRGRPRGDRRGGADRHRPGQPLHEPPAEPPPAPDPGGRRGVVGAPRIFVCNVATQVGETTGHRPRRPRRGARAPTPGPDIVDVVLANNRLAARGRCGRRRSRSALAWPPEHADAADARPRRRRRSGRRPAPRSRAARRGRDPDPRARGERPAPRLGGPDGLTGRRRRGGTSSGERLGPRPRPRPAGGARRDRPGAALRPAGRGGRSRDDGRDGPGEARPPRAGGAGRAPARAARARRGHAPAAGPRAPRSPPSTGTPSRRALPARLAARPVPRPRLAQPVRRPDPPRVRRRAATTPRSSPSGSTGFGLPAAWRLRRGRGVVTWKSGDTVGLFLRRIGATAALLELEARQVVAGAARRPEPGPQRGVGEPPARRRGGRPPGRGDRGARGRAASSPSSRTSSGSSPRPGARRRRRPSASWPSGSSSTAPPSSARSSGSSGWRARRRTARRRAAAPAAGRADTGRRGPAPLA